MNFLLNRTLQMNVGLNY